VTLIANIVTNVTTAPAPVLFLDACILLDVVRAPLRNNPSEVQSAIVFLSSAQKNPKTIHLLVASPIQTEWNTHVLGRVNECITAVNACNAVASICSHLALPAVASLPAGVPLLMPDTLRKLSADLLAACDTIDHDFAALGRAVDRIITNTHPVKQPDSKGAKDSVIIEHAIETTAELRTAGFLGNCLFVSSNTKDFADPGSTNLHSQLTGAFNPVNLQYVVSLAQAELILRNAGWAP
jgi:hypothetical protein